MVDVLTPDGAPATVVMFANTLAPIRKEPHGDIRFELQVRQFIKNLGCVARSIESRALDGAEARLDLWEGVYSVLRHDGERLLAANDPRGAAVTKAARPKAADLTIGVGTPDGTEAVLHTPAVPAAPAVLPPPPEVVLPPLPRPESRFVFWTRCAGLTVAAFGLGMTLPTLVMEGLVVAGLGAALWLSRSFWLVARRPRMKLDIEL